MEWIFCPRIMLEIFFTSCPPLLQYWGGRFHHRKQRLILKFLFCITGFSLKCKELKKIKALIFKTFVTLKLSWSNLKFFYQFLPICKFCPSLILKWNKWLVDHHISFPILRSWLFRNTCDFVYVEKKWKTFIEKCNG